MLERHYPTLTKTILKRQYPGKPTLKVEFGNGNGAIFENSAKIRFSLRDVTMAKTCKQNSLSIRPSYGVRGEEILDGGGLPFFPFSPETPDTQATNKTAT